MSKELLWALVAIAYVLRSPSAPPATIADGASRCADLIADYAKSHNLTKEDI